MMSRLAQTAICVCVLFSTALPTVFAAPHNRHPSSPPTAACGAGTITFRPNSHTAESRHYSCLLSSFYDGGTRFFIAHLIAPAHANRVTISVVHVASDYRNGTGGVVYLHTINTRPGVTALRGNIDFSETQRLPGAAGGTAFGHYFVSVYRGPNTLGRLLAVGQFEVFPD